MMISGSSVLKSILQGEKFWAGQLGWLTTDHQQSNEFFFTSVSAQKLDFIC
jgi:hypothetical protein